MNLLSITLAAVLATAPSTDGAAPPAAAKPAAAETPAQAPLAAQLARIDELYKRRDDRAAWTEQQRLVQASLARAPHDYGVLWRAARFYFWLSDDPGAPADQRSRWGKEGWDLAERAIAANPNDVAGHYFAALCIGNYALGLGIMKALAKGLDGKFRERLGRAEKLNPRYELSGIQIAWGRYYDKLPWPKRDRKKAEEHLRRALQMQPTALRARVYLAISYMDDDRAPEAKPLLEEVAAAAAGRYDAPEERRAKAIGAGLMPQLYAKLK